MIVLFGPKTEEHPEGIAVVLLNQKVNTAGRASSGKSAAGAKAAADGGESPGSGQGP